jgi:periplasmic protein TonB
MQRLAEQLLTAAAYATAANRFPVAAELLDAVDALGVLATEAAATRRSMQLAMEEVQTKAAKIVANETAPAESAAQAVLSSDESDEASPAAYTADEPAPLRGETSDGSVPAGTAMADAGTMVTDEPSKARLVKFSDLSIKKYVAPEFPRGALRRGLTGTVELRFIVHTDGSTGAIEIVNAEPSEIFVSSAQNAVEQWRFAPREDVVEARVLLRFEESPPL